MIIIIIIIIIIINLTYFIDNIPTIKILFTINSLKKTISSKHYLQFLPFKKKHLPGFDYKKIHFIKQNLFKLRTFHFN